MLMHITNAKDRCHPEMVESGYKPVQSLSLSTNPQRSKELQRNRNFDIKASEDVLIQPFNSPTMESGASFCSSGSDYSPSTTSPLSSFNSEVSFSEAEPDAPIPCSGAILHLERSPQSDDLPIPCLERLVIWRDDTTTKSRHIYAHISSDPTVPLHTLTLNPPSPAVQATLAGLSSPLVHLSIPLLMLPYRHRRGINSLVTISANSSNAVYLILDIYKQGVLVGSYEEEMTEESQSPFGSAQFSSMLPQQLVYGLYDTANRGEAGRKEIGEHTFIMRFLQEAASPTADDVTEVILTTVIEFYVQASSENDITLSYISLESPSSPVFTPGDLVPPSSPTVIATQPHGDNIPSRPKRGLKQARTLPRLSVTIPPGPHVEGVHVCTDSPADAPSRSMPPMDIPESALSAPPTPFSPSSQSILISLDAEAPSHLSYPFSLSSMSPRMLDLSTPDVSNSAPAWQISRPQGAPFSPFTPSFFGRHPHTARSGLGPTLSPVWGRSDGNVQFSRLSVLESDASSTRSPRSQYSCGSSIDS
ncbi:hypothetical protein BU17DRAFT_87165 [Hysterangium stoloniferum]|nr:hypothetical protein BU17DRAFT_87165 [Hysterangium stoloniferum]